MMFGWLLKRIFVDRRARAQMDKSRKKVGTAAVKSKPDKSAKVEDADERQKLIEETMAVYREKRAEYEKLDSNLRDKIDKAASEAFGGKKK